MLTFIYLALAIYLALVAAAVTIVIVATSGWYAKKCKKMTESIIDDCFKN